MIATTLDVQRHQVGAVRFAARLEQVVRQFVHYELITLHGRLRTHTQHDPVDRAEVVDRGRVHHLLAQQRTCCV